MSRYRRDRRAMRRLYRRGYFYPWYGNLWYPGYAYLWGPRFGWYYW